MSDVADRIEQFRKMAEADPGNELGHFSLGRAYLDAARPAEAVAPLRKVIELNPNISKAYQLLADALLGAGDKDGAIVSLTDGVKTAAARGDRMPLNEMTVKLRELGAAIPETATPSEAPAPAAVGEGEVFCKRCGKPGPKLPKPPLPGDFGRDIFENTCVPCWRAAIGQGTKVINELRLPLNDPQAQKIWDQHIREFLNLGH